MVSQSSSASTPSFEKTTRTILIGAALTLVGGSLWGINATVSKILMANYGVTPLWLSCVRELGACVLFFACAAAASPKQLIGAITDGRSWPKYIGCALICVLMVQIAYLCSIDVTNSGTATVLQSLNLLFVLLFTCMMAKRLPSKRESFGVLLAFAGTLLIATGGDLTSLKLPAMGLVWGLLNAISTAALPILPVMLMQRWGSFTINGIMFLISGLVLLPVAKPWANPPALDATGWALMAFTVVLGTFGAYWLFLMGSKMAGAMRATMLGTAEPVMATISAVLLTGVLFTPTDLIGFALILLMVFLVR